MFRNLSRSLLLATSMAALSVPVMAAEPYRQAEGGGSGQAPQMILEEIIVTAQRREERLQDVPVSVTVVSAAQLDRQNVAGIADLVRSVPSLTSSGNTGGSSNGSVGIRGISTSGFAQSSEASVSVVLDGVVLGRTQIGNLFDLERIEVLAGPQGMLFGKNASAGVINIVSKAPNTDEYETIIKSEIGNLDYLRQRATLNVPVADDAAIRVSGHYDRNGGYVHNTLLNKDNRNSSYGTRARFLWEPSDKLQVNIIADYDESQSNFGAGGNPSLPATYAIVKTPALASRLAACGIVASPTNNRNCSETLSKDFGTDRSRGVSAQFDYLFDNDYTLTSLTSRRWRNVGPELGAGSDTDLLPTDILSTNTGKYDYDTFSQELRVTSPAEQLVTFVGGLYYQGNKQDTLGLQGGTLGGLGAAFGLPATTRIGRVWATDIDQDSYAAFTQGRINVSEKFSLIAGGRYTRETLKDTTTAFKNRNAANPSAPSVQDYGFDFYTSAFAISDSAADMKVNNFSWKLGAQYDWDPNLMTYFTASRGFKGPAVNDTASPPIAQLIIEPEEPMYYELGMKGSFLDRRMLVTLALFSNKVDNFQTAVFQPATATNPTPGFSQGNAPHILSRGIELGFSGKPAPGFTLDGGVIYNRAKYSSDFLVACSPEQTRGVGTCSALGTTSPVKQLANTPEWRVLINGEYEHEISSTLVGYIQGDLVYQSGYDFSPTPNPVTRTGEQWLLGGRIGVRTDDGRYGLSIFGRNLLNNAYPFIQADSVSRFNGGGGSSYWTRPNFDWYRTYGVTLDVRF